jgi:hypothetical protein
MPAPAILEVSVRPPKRDAQSNVRKTVRSNGECWVATWIFRFANLKREPSACGAVDLVTTVTLFSRIETCVEP